MPLHVTRLSIYHHAVRTAIQLAAVGGLQVGFMLWAYGSHIFGLHLSHYVGLVVWIVLPSVGAIAADSRLVAKSEWQLCGSRREVMVGAVPVAMSLIALVLGAFLSINMFGT